MTTTETWARRIAKECAFRSICPGGHGDVDEIERAIQRIIERCAEEAERHAEDADVMHWRQACHRVAKHIRALATDPVQP